MDNFFDKVLHYYGKKEEKLFIINIGAMDGIMFDSMSAYAEIYNFDGLYVEPMKSHFVQTWYHEDTLGMPEHIIKNEIHFSDFFDLIYNKHIQN